MQNEITVQINSEFTGRIILHIENGLLKSHMPVKHGEFISSLEAFLEMAKSAGYQVQAVNHG